MTSADPCSKQGITEFNPKADHKANKNSSILSGKKQK